MRGGKVMRISTDKVKEGCILLKDVYSLTNTPIIKEKTVITKEHIKILQAFLIPEIDIESTLVNGEPFHGLEEEPAEEETLFIRKFLQASKTYEEEFKKWQSGLHVDITKIRNLLFPLVKVAENHTVDLFSLHHYTIKENYLYQHAVAIGILSSYIARKLNYTNGDILQVALAACLADAGMAKINPNIIKKKTSLTTEEYKEIKKHPIFSFTMVKDTPFLKDEAKLAIYQHHERINGSGYPHGEVGNKIHPFAKIIAVADVFHAMTSERLYKKKQSPFKVLEMMMEDHFGQYDIKTIQTLSRAMMNFSIGEKVELSDGRIAEIIFVDQEHPARPLVKIEKSGEILQLVNERQLFIQRVLNE